MAAWYPTLTKPSFNPPNWVFGPVWTTLYVLMGFAAWRVWRALGTLRHRAFALYGVELGLHLLWAILFFALHPARRGPRAPIPGTPAPARRPVPAFARGVVSHFALDAVPHWGEWASRGHFLRVAVPDGLAGLAAIGIFAAVAPPERRLAVLAGMAGAALPDIDKPTRLWFNWSPFPRAVDQFHSAIQREAPGRARYEVAAAAIMSAAALALLRKRR